MIPRKSPRRFLSLVLSLVCLAAGGAGALRAEDVKYPADGSGIVFTLPAGWTSTTAANGSLKCVAADGKFDVRIFSGESITDPATDLEAIAKKMAADSKLTDFSGKTSKETTHPDGLKTLAYMFEGKIEGVASTGMLGLIVTPSGSKNVFMIFDPTETVEAHSDDTLALVQSIKAAK